MDHQLYDDDCVQDADGNFFLKIEYIRSENGIISSPIFLQATPKPISCGTATHDEAVKIVTRKNQK